MFKNPRNANTLAIGTRKVHSLTKQSVSPRYEIHILKLARVGSHKWFSGFFEFSYSLQWKVNVKKSQTY